MTALARHAPQVRGWCPGALRPMESGDGLIVRLKFEAARLPLDTASEIARLALRFGNGSLDLTSRANLQLRGCKAAELPALHRELAGLGLLDEDADAEAARTLLVSPFAGEDPLAKADIRVVVTALGTRLATDAAVRRLPAKFGWMVDGNGVVPISQAVADARFFALGADEYRLDLATAAGWLAAGIARADDVPDLAAQIATTFLALPGRPGRMARATPGERARLIATLCLAPAPDDIEPEAVLPVGPIKLHGRLFAFGAGTAYGRLEAGGLEALAAIAADAGAAALYLTPFRALLFRCPAERREDIADRLAAAGFIGDSADPRRRIAACTGRPGCSAATIATRDLAESIARVLPRKADQSGILVHVSGCAKGCAHPAPALLTLVGQPDGTIGAIHAGRADAQPASVFVGGDLAARLPDLLGNAHV